MYAVIMDDFRIYWHSTEGMIAHNATPSRVACTSIGETCASVGETCASSIYSVFSMYLKIHSKSQASISGTSKTETLVKFLN